VYANEALEDPKIAAAVSLNFYPVPGRDASRSRTCAEVDNFEACALSIAECQGGCSGAKAQQLLQFVACMEGPSRSTNLTQSTREGNCRPFRSAECASKAGIDGSVLNSCVGDQSKLASIKSWILNHSEDAYGFPQLFIARNRSMDYSSVSDVKKDLCVGGVEAAC
jgi:hypothetical protein